MTEPFSKIDDALIVAMFGQMRLDSPGLEDVSAAVGAGDYAAAEAAYLQHYRAREQPVLDWGAEANVKASSADWDFLSRRPDTITWRDRDAVRPYISNERGSIWDRSEGLQRSDFTLLDHADMLLDNKVFIPYHPEDGVQDLGPEWDWEHHPPPGGAGRRWPMSLVYQYFQRALAQAWWLTDDERYVAKLVRTATDYVVYLPGKSDWMWLPDMQLAIHYQQVMPFILSWDELAPRDFCTIQYFLSGPCAESMEGVIGAPGNQLMCNGLGLLWIGVGMPEFEAAPRWRERGLREITDYYLNAGTYPDGSSTENSYGYVAGASLHVFQALKLTRGNGLAVPEGLSQAMVMRAEFLAFTSKPDGNYVWTGDSRRGSGFPYVRRMAEIEQRDDLRFVATSGERGKAPAHISFWYSWAGVGIMRSSWAADTNYLFFDVGPFGVVHGHEGKLAVEVVAYGRSLVEDLGVHSYSKDPRDVAWTEFFNGSSAHNTVIVDGKSQVRSLAGPKTTDEPLTNPWHSSTTCDYLAGEYEQGYGTPAGNSVVHHRSIAFVKARQSGGPEYWIITDRFTGSGDHTYEQLFHLVPIDVAVDAAARTVRTTSQGANLAFLPALPEYVELEVVEGREEPDLQGWYCGPGGAGRPVPAPCVIYRRSGPTPTMIQTVLWPMRPDSEACAAKGSLPHVQALSETDSGWLSITLPDGGVDLYCSPPARGTYEHEGVSFEGTACVVRLDREGGLHSAELVHGTALERDGVSLVQPGI